MNIVFPISVSLTAIRTVRRLAWRLMRSSSKPIARTEAKAISDPMSKEHPLHLDHGDPLVSCLKSGIPWPESDGLSSPP